MMEVPTASPNTDLSVKSRCQIVSGRSVYNRRKGAVPGRSVVQQCPDDLGNGKTPSAADVTDPVDQTFTVDRTDEFALDVARDLEAVVDGRFDFDVERQSTAGRRDRYHDRKGKRRPEAFRRSDDEGGPE